MKKYTFLFALLVLIGSAESAIGQIRLKSIYGGFGVFTRSYEGNDETRMFSVFDIEGVPSIAPLGTATQLLPSVGLELGLAEWLSLDGRIGFINKKFTASQVLTGLTIEETISQRILPVSVGVKWLSNELLESRMSYFFGAGVNRYFIQNEVQRIVVGGQGSVRPSTYAGNNYGGYLQAGLDYLFDSNLSIGFDGRYHMGSYVQNYRDTENVPRRLKVPVRGFEFGISLKYNFGKSMVDDNLETNE